MGKGQVGHSKEGEPAIRAAGAHPKAVKAHNHCFVAHSRAGRRQQRYSSSAKHQANSVVQTT